jgi:hypothetical protein
MTVRFSTHRRNSDYPGFDTSPEAIVAAAEKAEEVGFDAISVKSLATIDRMSGGRLIAGVGAGWNEAEFAALGVPFHERGARTNEYLRL